MEYKAKPKRLKLINDIEIINSDIFAILKKKNWNLNNIMTGKSILGGGKIIMYMSDYKQNIFFEIGSFIKEDIKIEYILDINELKSPQCINDIFGKIEIQKTMQNFDKNKDVNIIEYTTSENGISNILNFYKVDEKKIKEISKYSNQYDNKLKSLVLLSIYQNILFQSQNKEEKVFLLNKNYIDIFYYEELNEI